jgi:ABC-type dipeptide/oligopeptide/nickel transport system permease subunit
MLELALAAGIVSVFCIVMIGILYGVYKGNELITKWEVKKHAAGNK